jgi:hypothetical protein
MIYRTFILLLICASLSFAKTSVSQMESIPLPGQLSYVGKGISLGLGLGTIHPLSGEDDVLAAWNGVFEYFYGTHFSAGGNVWIYGGNIDSHTMILFARYRVHGRIHCKPHDKFSFYIAPLLWFENTDIESIHDDIVHEEDGESEWVEKKPASSVTGVYENAPEQNGFALGGELGFGWKFIGNLGLTGNVTFEKSFSTSVLVNSSFGFAYDIREHFSFLQENFNAVWLSFEGSFRRYLQKKWDRTARNFLFGINLAL